MKVPFYDLEKENKLFEKELTASFKKTLSSSWFILGNNVDLFEKEWARYVKTKHAISVGNGTDALILALKALDIKQGDEVIVPAYTFVATAFAVSVLGATPVFVDVDPKTHVINPLLIEKKITKKTRAIIPVHLYGNLADMDEIMKIAKKHKLFVVEDAAQAHGALYKNKKAGGIGDIGCFSFYPSKNLGALGDAGITVTQNKKIADRLKSLRNYGQIKKYHSNEIGVNSRLDEIQAGFLYIKLKHLDSQNKKRRELAALYRRKLLDLPVIIPEDTKNSQPVHHLFTIQVKKRDTFIKKIERLGVQVLIHYPVPLHLQKAYRKMQFKKGSFPESERIADSTVSLPFFPSMSWEQLNYVVRSIQKVL